MKPQRPRVDPIRNPTLFQKEELDETDESPNSLTVERPYSEPGLCLGTSAFYPKGMRSADYLAFYAHYVAMSFMWSNGQRSSVSLPFLFFVVT
jgi:hypothetical protein